MIKAVLDTNTLVSGLIKRGQGGIPDQILQRVATFELYLSEAILTETQQVLHYARIFNKYHLTDAQIETYLLYLRHIAIMVVNPPTLNVIKADPKDNMILACALEAQADYLVSGDTHLKDLKCYQGVTMIAPAQFLKKLRELKGEV